MEKYLRDPGSTDLYTELAFDSIKRWLKDELQGNPYRYCKSDLEDPRPWVDRLSLEPTFEECFFEVEREAARCH